MKKKILYVNYKLEARLAVSSLVEYINLSGIYEAEHIPARLDFVPENNCDLLICCSIRGIEELIERLRIFAKENSKIPIIMTHSGFPDKLEEDPSLPNVYYIDIRNLNYEVIEKILS